MQSREATGRLFYILCEQAFPKRNRYAAKGRAGGAERRREARVAWFQAARSTSTGTVRSCIWLI